MIKKIFSSRSTRYILLIFCIVLFLSIIFSPKENNNLFYPNLPIGSNSVGLVKIEGIINKSEEIVSKIDLFRKNPKISIKIRFFVLLAIFDHKNINKNIINGTPKPSMIYFGIIFH